MMTRVQVEPLVRWDLQTYLNSIPLKEEITKGSVSDSTVAVASKPTLEKKDEMKKGETKQQQPHEVNGLLPRHVAEKEVKLVEVKNDEQGSVQEATIEAPAFEVDESETLEAPKSGDKGKEEMVNVPNDKEEPAAEMVKEKVFDAPNRNPALAPAQKNAASARAANALRLLQHRVANLPSITAPAEKQLEISVKKLFSVAALKPEKAEKKEKKA